MSADGHTGGRESVKDILLDTGCSRILVHQSLVPESKLKEGNVVAIRCTHGNTVLYPLADMTMEVNGRQISVEAGVSETLPVDHKEEVTDVLAVTTRATTKAKEPEM